MSSDQQESLQACANECGGKRIPCWSPGGRCPKPDDPACELCGACGICKPDAFAAEKGWDPRV